MFNPIEIPFGCVMLFNAARLKKGVSIEDVELAIGEMCNTVRNTYSTAEGGFIGGQVFRYAGFVSEEGSIGNRAEQAQRETGDVVIVTYWKSFDQHEKSHADSAFKEKFSALAQYCEATWELGYEMLWQANAQPPSV